MSCKNCDLSFERLFSDFLSDLFSDFFSGLKLHIVTHSCTAVVEAGRADRS